VVFGALVLAVLLLILANRDLTRPALMGVVAANPWLWRMAAAVGLLLVAVLGLPWLRDVMGLALPGAAGLAMALGLLVLCGAWLELLRRVSGRRAGASRLQH
jgi:P-type Ca2+ transporter type 2C